MHVVQFIKSYPSLFRLGHPVVLRFVIVLILADRHVEKKNYSTLNERQSHATKQTACNL